MTITEGLARDGYCGIDIELPDGSTVHCKALTLAKAIEFLGLIEEYGNGDIGAFKRLLQEFPKAVGASKAFEQLTPGEVVDALMNFCAARRGTPISPIANQPNPTNPSESTT